jgi:integrase
MSDRRTRGQGSLFRKPGSPYWWIAYYAGGAKRRESTKMTSESKAEKILRARLGAVDAGTYAGPEAKRATFADLVEMLRVDYANRRRRSWSRADRVTRAPVPAAGDVAAKPAGPLFRHFGTLKAHEITSRRVEHYKADRRAENAAPASIDYELAILRRMFRLAKAQGEVRDLPNFELLHVQNARRGFFERPDFEALRRALPEESLRAVVTFAYHTGWRIPSEVLALTWDRVDLAAGIVRLEPGTTKSGEPRTFYVNGLPELKATLEAQRARTTALERATGQIVPFVFHRAGKPIRDYRHAWLAACKRASLIGRIPHDFRRTAVRNLERAGVSRSVAMLMVGHRTESIYQRYAIVNEADQREAVAKLAALAVRDAKQRRGVLPFPKTGTDR